MTLIRRVAVRSDCHFRPSVFGVCVCVMCGGTHLGKKNTKQNPKYLCCWPCGVMFLSLPRPTRKQVQQEFNIDAPPPRHRITRDMVHREEQTPQLCPRFWFCKRSQRPPVGPGSETWNTFSMPFVKVCSSLKYYKKGHVKFYS